MKIFKLISLILLIAQISYALDLPLYKAKKLEEFKLSSIGSDSMGGLMQGWIKEYKNFQPKAEIRVVSRGSASAPPALVEGIADLGPMARPMKTQEIEDFMEKFGFEPTELKTAIAAVVIYVSKDNPLKSISIDQLDAIYSKDNLRQASRVFAWADLGVKGEFAKENVRALLLDDNETLSDFFKQKVMLQSDFAAEIEQASFSQTISVLQNNKHAISFGPYTENLPEGVKVLAVVSDNVSVLPSKQTLADSSYPLSRFLNLSFVSFPEEGIEPELKDFFSFILSKEGQRVVQEQGFVSLSAELVKGEREKL